ncbi:MAG: endonuclease III [Fretibacterium sp.]|nr:endonuclease III [Fretibacterium sp.]
MSRLKSDKAPGGSRSARSSLALSPDFTGTGEWIKAVLDCLEERWGNEANPPALGHDEPLDGLVLTVLSQNTNDRNRDVAFTRLKERFPTWELAAEAAVAEIEDAVRPAGLGPSKAGYIARILERVREDFGGYSLAPLRGYGRDEARKYLLSLPGVGEKTAACVLMFDLNMPAFPVDTHVSRVCRRIGFVPQKATPEAIGALMEKETPPDRYLGAHINLIEHGRAVCSARRPLCEGCPVIRFCCTGAAAEPSGDTESGKETERRKKGRI